MLGRATVPEEAQNYRALDTNLTGERTIPVRAHTCASVGQAAVVLGIGNVLLGDDGAGLKVLERMQQEPEAKTATILDGGTLSFTLLSYIEFAEAVLVVDAANLDRPPGSVALFQDEAMDRFLGSVRRRTVHEVSLIDLWDMARLQGCLPRQRALLCIQPQCIDWSDSLSPPVAAAIPEAVRQALGVLQGWRSE